MSKIEIDDEEFVDQSNAARQYHVAERTLRRWNLPTKRLGTRVYYKRRDIAHMIRSRASMDRNPDQHRVALDSLGEYGDGGGFGGGDGTPQFHLPGAPHYGGNVLRILAYSVVEDIVWQIQSALGQEAAKWQEKYSIDPAVLGALLSHVGVIVAAAAGGHLAMKYDERFEEECGFSVDEFCSRIARRPIRSLPGEWNMFITGKEFPASLQAWVEQGLKLMSPPKAGQRRKKQPREINTK